MKGLLVSGFAAIGTGSGAMLTLHAEAGLDPFHSVISEYAWASGGWLLPASLTLFALGSALIAEALRRSGVDRRVVWLLVAWGTCMFLIGAFPTDRPGVPLSLSGGIHRYAAFAAFLAMPLAGMLLARARVRYAPAMKVLCGVALGALLLVVVPYVVRMLGIPLDNADIPAGLTQRVVVVSELAVLALIGFSMLAKGRRRQPTQAARSSVLA
ncbi:DUF998 domain-containing protein [Nonomuraea endophytica]|uniref:Apolipoprotein N-acyltransferase n=1 Tax=Nonomuraea endophytica TaxID=714136 RepID=A0A7W7ZZ72_9ACTN|nr:DUF998 domain-containing protein [Nonomuraea endophytica]MBB5076547.1 apolipoprotein N-acyltransferase [Nonomuraea endophytica]